MMYDVLIIGAGLSGIWTLRHLKNSGLHFKAFEAGSGVGGTWFWNRYPGIRCDSESSSYIFHTSEEVLNEWDWTETFASGEETLSYAEFLTARFELRQFIQLNTRIVSAHYQDHARSWILTDSSGHQYVTRFLITAMGVLSQPTLPAIPGRADFAGEAFHTARWPSEGGFVSRGKRIGVVGTGASGIQVIQELVKEHYEIESLTVFQRTASWTGPLHNTSLSTTEMQEIRQNYPDIIKKCSTSGAGFVHHWDTRRTFDVPEEERHRFWEDLYSQPGFAKWLCNFVDINFDPEANAAFGEFMANKVMLRVRDPDTARKLIPRDHGFGTKRVPLETKYYEVYNDPRVRLVDLKHDTHIKRITPTGIELEQEHIPLDTIIYATGFDAITGAFSHVDIRGTEGRLLSEEWSDGPQTYLGIFSNRFPNMMAAMGPHQHFGNHPRSIEFVTKWIYDLIQFCLRNGITYVEAPAEAVGEWTHHVRTIAEGLLANDVDAWWSGVNTNVPGKQTRYVARYTGPGPQYRARCEEVSNKKYQTLTLGLRDVGDRVP